VKARASLLTPALFIAPNFLGFLVFTAGPVLYSLVASFTNSDLTKPSAGWIGLENYRELMTDRRFWLYFVNTIYLMAGIPVAILGSLFVAMLLNQKLKGIIVFRTMFYLPSFTAGVAIMILWKALYNPDFGAINATLRALAGLVGLGHVSLPGWLGSNLNLLGLDPEHVAFTSKYFGIGAKDALIIMGVWIGIGGNNMLLYLAALSNVPPDLIEAAHLDGAGRWATFRHVIWPQLAPTTFFITIMSIIGGLQGGFEQARIMTGGGPVGTTTTLGYYIYTEAFVRFQIGYASAISWVLFAMIFAFTLIYWKIGNKELSY
jgi:multiple sugar transport system permease protein